MVGSCIMDPIAQYHKPFSASQKVIIRTLRAELDKILGPANSKIWHGAPVWFVGDNPVAGYSVNSRGVCLLFWNGRAFKEDSLHNVGKFYAAEVRYNDVSEIKVTKLRSLIKKAKTQVWDSASHIRAARKSSK